MHNNFLRGMGLDEGRPLEVKAGKPAVPDEKWFEGAPEFLFGTPSSEKSSPIIGKTSVADEQTINAAQNLFNTSCPFGK